MAVTHKIKVSDIQVYTNTFIVGENPISDNKEVTIAGKKLAIHQFCRG